MQSLDQDNAVRDQLFVLFVDGLFLYQCVYMCDLFCHDGSAHLLLSIELRKEHERSGCRKQIIQSDDEEEQKKVRISQSIDTAMANYGIAAFTNLKLPSHHR